MAEPVAGSRATSGRPPRLRALVLAAGRGERLRPLSFEFPKPLLPVAGKSVAAWTLDRLVGVGCEAAALNLHHLGGAIRAAFGATYTESFDSRRRGRRRSMPLHYSDESGALLGTGGALPPLAEFLQVADLVLLVNGDSLCRWPLGELVARHRRARASVTLLLSRSADPRRFGGGVAVEAGRIVAFRPGSLAWEAAATRRVFAGAAVLDPALLARLPAGVSDIVSALYEPLLDAGEPIAALETSRSWFDLGTPARYLEAALACALEGLPAGGARVVRGAEVAPDAELRRTVVEAGARVGAGVRLTDALVLPGAAVGAGARVARTIVGPNVAVAPGSAVAGVLLTNGAGGAVVATPL